MEILKRNLEILKKHIDEEIISKIDQTNAEHIIVERAKNVLLLFFGEKFSIFFQKSPIRGIFMRFLKNFR